MVVGARFGLDPRQELPVFTMECVDARQSSELKSRARPRRELDGAGLLTLGSTHEFICNPVRQWNFLLSPLKVEASCTTSNYFESASRGPPDSSVDANNGAHQVDMVNSLFTTSGGGFGPPPNIPLAPDRYWELIPVSQKETI